MINSRPMASCTLLDGPQATLPQQTLIIRHLRRAGYRVIDAKAASWTKYLAMVLLCWREDIVIVNSWLSRCARQPDPARQRMLERVAIANRVACIWCVPTVKQIRSNGQGVADHKAMSELPTAVPLVPWHPMFEEDMDLLIEYVNKARTPTNEGPGIGHWNPDNVALLVGERSTTKRNLPFVRVDRIGCSYWLAQQLDSYGIGEQALYWIDAQRPTGELTKPDFLSTLQPRLVLALGQIATEWCEAQAQPHLRVSHPQRWKRFKHHQLYPLGNYLETVQ